MNADRIVIDQKKIHLSDDIAARMKPGSEFPRSLAWWQHIVPCWITASEDLFGHIILSPNGWRADGHVDELTPAVLRRDMQAANAWLFGWNRGQIDFADAIVND